MQTRGFTREIRKRVQNRGYRMRRNSRATDRFTLRPRELGAQPERETRGFLRGVYGQTG